MITNDEKWQYLAAKSLSALLRGIKSKYDGDFHYLNCFHSYCTKCKLKKHKMFVRIMIIVIQKCQKKIIKC